MVADQLLIRMELCISTLVRPPVCL